MKRVAVVAVLLALFAMPVAAEDYFAILATEDRAKDLRIDGQYYTDANESGTTLTVHYTITLHEDRAYNSTEIDPLVVYLADENGSIAEKSLGSFSITDNSSASGIDRFTAAVSPGDVTAFGFRANHTALLSGGGTVDRVVNGTVPISIEVPDARILSMETNMSEVVRGEELFVNGTAENADVLHHESGTLDVLIDGRFSGWLPVPVDRDPGPQNITYRFRSELGSTTSGTVSTTVVNVPPTLEMTVPATREQGRSFDVEIDASDETPGLNVTARFANETRQVSGGSTGFPTETVPPGNHTVTVTAVDRDGATEQRNATIEILPAETDGTGEGDDEGDSLDDTPAFSDDPLRFLGAFVDFLGGFLDFLNPF